MIKIARGKTEACLKVLRLEIGHFLENLSS